MKPSELYKLKPDSYTYCLDALAGFGYNHVPEIEALQHTTVEHNERVKILIYGYKNFDWRRIWLLAAVTYQDEFVMIIQNAGREGDDHEARFITDPHKYREMVEYIKTLISEETEEELADVVDPDEDIPRLTDFYGHHL